MSGRPETPQGDQRSLKAMQGVSDFFLTPAETFVYVVFHFIRIMYVNLITVYANFAQEAR